MFIPTTKLDTFRTVFTINYPGELTYKGNALENKELLMGGKLLTWLPVAAQITGVAFLILFRSELKAAISSESREDRKFAIACVARCAIAIFATPLLFPIDLVGTAVKAIIDLRNKTHGPVD